MNEYQKAFKKIDDYVWGKDEPHWQELSSASEKIAELVDRATPKKPTRVTALLKDEKREALKNDWVVLDPQLCANCKQEIDWIRRVNEKLWKYCPYCGQALDRGND